MRASGGVLEAQLNSTLTPDAKHDAGKYMAFERACERRGYTKTLQSAKVLLTK